MDEVAGFSYLRTGDTSTMEDEDDWPGDYPFCIEMGSSSKEN